MDSLFAILLERLAWTSAQSVLLVGALLLLVRAVPKLPAATRCTLWWLVGVQAVAGLAWSSPLELQVLPSSVPAVVVSDVQASSTSMPAGTLHDQRGVALATVDAAADGQPVTVVQPTDLQPTTLLGAAWLLGVLLMAGWTLRGYRHSRHLLRHATPCADRALCDALQLAADAHGLRRAPRLMLSAQIDSPQLIGPWRPVLLLPARQLATLQGDALDMALTHELVHLQRRDLWLGLVPSLAQHLFFFHPLVHLAAREYAVQREIACDAAVVAGHRHCRQDYGRLLVQLGVSPRTVVGVASASPTYLSLKRRLQMLQHTGSFPRVASLLVIAAVATAGVAPLRLVAADVPPAAAPAANRPAADAGRHAAPLPAPAVLPDDAPHGVLAPAAPPGPPTPRTPVTPPAPPAVPLPAVPAPPPAPVPPAPPSGGIITHGRLDLSARPAQAFVLVNKDDNFVDGSLDDIRQAQRDAKGEQVLWVRRNDQRYVIRDPQALAQVRRDYAEVAAIGRKQAEQGHRQATAASVAAARAERAAIAAEAASAAREAVATLDVDAIRADAAAAVREAGVARIAAEAAREEASVARRDVAQQANLAAQQERASARARTTVEAVIKAAIDSGKAQRLE